MVRLAAHVSNWVKVPNPPGSGKDIAEGKGVHREVGSEGELDVRNILTHGQISDINGWLYHRIRMCIWKQWKET